MATAASLGSDAVWLVEASRTVPSLDEHLRCPGLPMRNTELGQRSLEVVDKEGSGVRIVSHGRRGYHRHKVPALFAQHTEHLVVALRIRGLPDLLVPYPSARRRGLPLQRTIFVLHRDCASWAWRSPGSARVTRSSK